MFIGATGVFILFPVRNIKRGVLRITLADNLEFCVADSLVCPA